MATKHFSKTEKPAEFTPRSDGHAFLHFTPLIVNIKHHQLLTEMPKVKKSAVPPSGSVFLKKSAVPSRGAITGPKEPVVSSQEPGVTAPDTPAEQSTPGGHAEVAASGGEAANCARSAATNSGMPEGAAALFKFTPSGNTFKFNFSVP